jgi:hypothetical protein
MMINLQAIWERCRRVLSSLAAYFTGAWPLLAITLFIQALSAQLVQGTLDSVTNATCEIAGWARDPTNPAPIDVSIYRDGDATSGTLVQTFLANLPRTDLPYPDQNHGFDQTFSTNPLLADGKAHSIYAYGVIASGATGPLNGNGKTIQCASLGTTMTANVRDYGATGDGVTDDSNAIQTAIDDTLPGGTVLVPAGTYMLGTGHYTLDYGQIIDGVSSESYALKLWKNVTLQGVGRASILKLMPVRLGIGFFLADNILVEELVFDGNGAQRLQLDPATGISYGWPQGLIVSGLWDGSNPNPGSKVFSDSELRYGLEDATGGLPAPGLTVEGCYIHDNGASAFDPSSKSQGGGVAASLNGGSNQVATNNVIIGNTFGPRVGFGSVGTTVSYNVTLGNCGPGLTLGGAEDTPPPEPESGFSVLHNWVEGNGGACEQPGLLVWGGQDGTISNNFVLNNAPYTGVLFADKGAGWPASLDWQVQGNIIQNNQSTGLDITMNSSGIAVQGNQIIDNGASLADQVYVDPATAGGVNADWPTANTISYSPLSSTTVPAFVAAGIVNAASEQPGAISPGEILAIYGSNLGPTKLVSASPNSDGRFERGSCPKSVIDDKHFRSNELRLGGLNEIPSKTGGRAISGNPKPSGCLQFRTSRNWCGFGSRAGTSTRG